MNAVNSPSCASPYPRLAGDLSPKGLDAPMVLAGAHIAEFQGLGVLVDHLQGPRLILATERGISRRGFSVISLVEEGPILSLKSGVDTLRAGGYVLILADGRSGSRIQVDVCGRRIDIGRGSFAMARLASAPMLPVIARWKGRSIEICAGDLIPPSNESEMVVSYVRWLEGHLAEQHDEVRRIYIKFRSGGQLSKGSLVDSAFQESVSDLPIA
jgi:hypothetical protein